MVSTHSRLKAAGPEAAGVGETYEVSTHSRLKAAGTATDGADAACGVSTHSRLKAAGTPSVFSSFYQRFQHTAA